MKLNKRKYAIKLNEGEVLFYLNDRVVAKNNEVNVKYFKAAGNDLNAKDSLELYVKTFMLSGIERKVYDVKNISNGSIDEGSLNVWVEKKSNKSIRLAFMPKNDEHVVGEIESYVATGSDESFANKYFHKYISKGMFSWNPNDGFYHSEVD
ncbi:hypothetical protein [Zooshikella harenae]|uniref:Uncharacterized protein n=1 Tax=Zooshikella harenae TaxID=2827238 RepID=A0ABS5ZG75_9GAMM|nr:hypothetical protein [Zooshikella harenae]MBU2712970.1 hypothetical protein [Zooshikella harenae]